MSDNQLRGREKYSQDGPLRSVRFRLAGGLCEDASGPRNPRRRGRVFRCHPRGGDLVTPSRRPAIRRGCTRAGGLLPGQERSRSTDAFGLVRSRRGTDPESGKRSTLASGFGDAEDGRLRKRINSSQAFCASEGSKIFGRKGIIFAAMKQPMGFVAVAPRARVANRPAVGPVYDGANVAGRYRDTVEGAT